jgi:hypothetical protein
MTSPRKLSTSLLHDPTTGAVVGAVGADGQEYLFPLLTYPLASQNFNDTSATPGNATINSARGRVSAAAGATSLVVTSSLCQATSYIGTNISTNDATAVIKSVVPSAGSFTINLVAPTAQTNIDFIVLR